MTFKEYYSYYLNLHQTPACRRLHVLGNLFTIIYMVFCVLNNFWAALLVTPFIVYPFAWIGHIFFEKNKPAAWTHPLWAKACDWLMIRDILLRKIKW
jgi:hypothetical protein